MKMKTMKFPFLFAQEEISYSASFRLPHTAARLTQLHFWYFYVNMEQRKGAAATQEKINMKIKQRRGKNTEKGIKSSTLPPQIFIPFARNHQQSSRSLISAAEQWKRTGREGKRATSSGG